MLELTDNKCVDKQDLIENAPSIIMISDVDNRILYMNRVVSGFSKEDVIGKEIFDFILPEYHYLVKETIKKAIETGEHQSYVIRGAGPDGQISWYETQVGAVKRGGKVAAIASFILDVSDRIRAEKMLEQKNIALREVVAQIEVEKNKIKEDISANVDEILMPILKKLRVKGDSRKYIDLLRRNLENLTSSFGHRISGKRFRLTPREIEICDMVKNGLSSKEISGLLGVSHQTIEKHRKNIREKLRISNKGINLITFLQQL